MSVTYKQFISGKLFHYANDKKVHYCFKVTLAAYLAPLYNNDTALQKTYDID